MSDFTYKCAGCNCQGTNSDLVCFNCRQHSIVIMQHDGQEHIGCPKCGIPQTPPCGSCKTTVITWNMITKSNWIVTVAFLVFFAVMLFSWLTS